MFFATLTSMLLAGLMAYTPATQRSTPAAGTAPVAFAGTTAFSPATDFNSKDGRFTVFFPDGYTKPKLEKSDIPSELGTIKLYMYTAVNISEGVCLVGYSDINGVTMTDELKEKMLDGAKEGALNNMHATLEDEQTISIDGNPGRSLRFVTENEGQQMHGRFDYYMVNNRLYQIGYIAIAEDALNADHVNDYFSSFKLVAKSAGKKKGK